MSCSEQPGKETVIPEVKRRRKVYVFEKRGSACTFQLIAFIYGCPAHHTVKFANLHTTIVLITPSGA
jgi:hypothetical protein